jgi:uncharacterized membrane protein YhaH (DUF805 family)
VSIAKLFFSLDGRIRRRDYWLYSILVGVGAFAVDFMAYRTWGHGINYIRALKLAETQPLGPFLLTVYVVNVLIVALRFPISAKRWHDRNRATWIAALLSGYSLLMQAVALGLHVTDIRHAPLTYSAMSWISIPLGLWAFIECGCMDGTKGPNRFGPSPKQVKAAAEVF